MATLNRELVTNYQCQQKGRVLRLAIPECDLSGTSSSNLLLLATVAHHDSRSQLRIYDVDMVSAMVEIVKPYLVDQ